MTIRLWQASMLAGLVVANLVLAGGADLPAISKYLSQVEPRLWLAGSLDMNALRHWDPASTVIIDLRTADEGIAKERAQVQAVGMDYYSVPVTGATLVDADLRRLAELLRERSADSVIVHCVSGNRAGLAWGALQLDHGQDLPAVLHAVSGVVTKDTIVQALEERAAAGPVRIGGQRPATPVFVSP